MPETAHRAASQYIERMGLLWESQGLPRIAGRMLGYLALQPAPSTLDDIAGDLGVSKGSVSSDARRLESLGLVERSSRAGDRRDYYAISPDMPARVLEQKVAELERLHAAMSAACQLPGTSDVVRSRLAGFRDFQRYVIDHLREMSVSLHHAGAARVPDPGSERL